MEQLINALKIAFASEYAFALKAQNFHWNTEGPDFLEFHMLFEKIYDEVYGSIDDFAENIRKSGAYTPASLSRFSMLTVVEDENQIIDPRAMTAELLADSDKLAQLMAMVYKMAEGAGEFGLANFLADRQDAHRKHSWFLRSTLK
jgi:starvation-inducible DNA-binding protein